MKYVITNYIQICRVDSKQWTHTDEVINKLSVCTGSEHYTSMRDVDFIPAISVPIRVGNRNFGTRNCKNY